MDSLRARFACDWARALLPPRHIHKLIARAVAQTPHTSEALCLLEVAQRMSPPMFSALFDPPEIGELFLIELLTWEQGCVNIVVVSNHKESCNGNQSRSEDDQLVEG